ASRRRQRREDPTELGLEQVREAGVRKPLLGLVGPAREDRDAALAGGLDPGRPERRLPDPRGALEHQRRRPVEHAVQEIRDRTKLVLSGNKLGHPLSVSSVDSKREPCFTPRLTNCRPPAEAGVEMSDAAVGSAVWSKPVLETLRDWE